MRLCTGHPGVAGFPPPTSSPGHAALGGEEGGGGALAQSNKASEENTDFQTSLSLWYLQTNLKRKRTCSGQTLHVHGWAVVAADLLVEQHPPLSP